MTDPTLETMIANLPARTGRSLDEWVAVVRDSGLAKHGEIVSFLKTEHGMTHGYANLVATTARETPTTDADLVAAQYEGAKAALTDSKRTTSLMRVPRKATSSTASDMPRLAVSD